MADYIEIEGLLLRAIIGVNPDERVNLQDVLIDIRLETDTRGAAASDDIADAVNYRTLTKEVIAFVESSEFLLVERLAEGVADLCLRDQRVSRVWVKLRKPGAVRFAKSVGVSIERSRGDAR
jgi:dihydroneopterin aldolase/D-erythro-7,8-dihydroneopterin triphosphate epimerase